MSKEELAYINKQGDNYMKLIMDKHRGSAHKEKRISLCNKLAAWRSMANTMYHTQTPRTFRHGPDFQPITIERNDTWELSRI